MRYESVTEIPPIRYEKKLQYMFGENWRESSPADINGALGVAIIQCILDGCDPDFHDICYYLNLPKKMLREAWVNLDMNGAFNMSRDAKGRWKTAVELDRKALEANDFTAWGYYAGYASGYCGTYLPKNMIAN